MFNSITGLETDKISQKLLIWQFIFNVTLSGQVGKCGMWQYTYVQAGSSGNLTEKQESR